MVTQPKPWNLDSWGWLAGYCDRGSVNFYMAPSLMISVSTNHRHPAGAHRFADLFGKRRPQRQQNGNSVIGFMGAAALPFLENLSMYTRVHTKMIRILKEAHDEYTTSRDMNHETTKILYHEKVVDLHERIIYAREDKLFPKPNPYNKPEEVWPQYVAGVLDSLGLPLYGIHFPTSYIRSPILEWIFTEQEIAKKVMPLARTEEIFELALPHRALHLRMLEKEDKEAQA